MPDEPLVEPTAAPAASDRENVLTWLYRVCVAGMFSIAIIDLTRHAWLDAARSTCMAGFYALLFRALKPYAKRWQSMLYWACIIGYTAAWSWQRAHRAPL